MKKFTILLGVIISILVTGCTSINISNTSEADYIITNSSTVNSVIITNNSTFSLDDVKNSMDWTIEDGPYIEINNNIPFFTEYTTAVFENYADLDNLGRCGVAFANICTELQPTEKRGQIGSIKPSGWQTANYNEYPGLIDGNYLYNRCHLIGFQLAGENTNEKNLITGTRYLNINGMLPFENMVDDYIDDNPNNHVLYRVTPIYNKNDLVAQGVLMEAYSVEDNGALQFCVWCYNVQPEICIDYSNGDNFYVGENTEISTTNEITDSENTEVTYILNTYTNKIHTTNCTYAINMKEENKAETHKHIDELEANGYTICGICKPAE